MPASAPKDLKPEFQECEGFYKQAMIRLTEADIPFLVAGSSALQLYTGIERNSGDFDLFLCPQEVESALETLRAAGYEAAMAYSHWIAKARCGRCSLDIIFRSGNGISRVEPSWFEHSRTATVLGLQARICPAEEIIWIKSYIQERERFDGADVVHLIVRQGAWLDWRRLLDRFGPDWRLLLGHLIFAQFSFPSERDCVPAWVMDELLRRLENERSQPAPEVKTCLGTLLSRTQYLPDIRRFGHTDGRRESRVAMNDEQIAAWTDAIEPWRIPK